MRALSVRQPWASLIAAGLKPIENRTWYPDSVRDTTILIVSGKTPETREDLEAAAAICDKLGLSLPESRPLGMALATVHVAGALQLQDGEIVTDSWLDDIDTDSLEWWQRDCIGWILQDPQPVDPYPVKGKFGLFEVAE